MGVCDRGRACGVLVVKRHTNTRSSLALGGAAFSATRTAAWSDGFNRAPSATAPLATALRLISCFDGACEATACLSAPTIGTDGVSPSRRIAVGRGRRGGGAAAPLSVRAAGAAAAAPPGGGVHTRQWSKRFQ